MPSRSTIGSRVKKLGTRTDVEEVLKGVQRSNKVKKKPISPCTLSQQPNISFQCQTYIRYDASPGPRRKSDSLGARKPVRFLLTDILLRFHWKKGKKKNILTFCGYNHRHTARGGPHVKLVIRGTNCKACLFGIPLESYEKKRLKLKQVLKHAYTLFYKPLVAFETAAKEHVLIFEFNYFETLRVSVITTLYGRMTHHK